MNKNLWNESNLKKELGLKIISKRLKRVLEFIDRQPDDANIIILKSSDYRYCERKTREPMYDYEIIGHTGITRYYVYIISYKP